ncbi:unnamed protein product [Camellia sinensis]
MCDRRHVYNQLAALRRESRTKFLSSSPSLSTAAASCSSSRAHSSPSITNQCRSFSFSSAFRSVPRWSHGVDWKSPTTDLRTKRAPGKFRIFAPPESNLTHGCGKAMPSPLASKHAFKGILTGLPKPGHGEFGKFYSLPALNDPRIVVPVDLVIDHSVQVDVARSENAVQANMELEFQRNKERFAFLKWGSNAFQNLLVVPPGSGIVHQMCCFNLDGMLYPDSVVGTDSHTTIIDGLGVAGWGVGGIFFLIHKELEVLKQRQQCLARPMSMVLPGVVGFELSGKLCNGVTATNLVLTVTQMLRKHGVVGKFVEFYGEGVVKISLADRATIANMSPKYGATMGFFPVDHVTLQYLKLTGRIEETVAMIEAYLRANNMFVDYNDLSKKEHTHLDLADVEPCISGPKRPHDRVPLKEMKTDWHSCLDNKVGFNLNHGSVVIAAIMSCTNTSNPSVMLGAGLVAKKACELGLQVKSWIKTSLAPGSGVTKYLLQSELQKYLNEQGFHIVGYGCTTCIGNSGDMDESVASAISENDIVAAAVLFGNRNFEGRVHPLTELTTLPLLL